MAAAAPVLDIPVRPRITPVALPVPARDVSVDLLRGLVMVLMVLDHVRAYLSNVNYDALDLSQTTVPLFMTRWITHFCAPIFVLLAGMSARMAGRTRTRPELARYLATRGLWLVVLEVTVISFGWYFTANFSHGFILQVIWAIGISMLALSALIFLPVRMIAAIAMMILAGHNSLDAIQPGTGLSGDLWRLLHVQGPLTTLPLFAIYPVLPWIGVMALGYVLGGAFRRTGEERRVEFVVIGAAMIVVFVLLRAAAIYGDPAPWLDGPRAALGFLRTTKYPPSLQFVLMTIGPGLIALALIDRLHGVARKVLLAYGRVPLFFYVTHIYLVHLAAMVTSALLGFGAASATVLYLDFPETYGVGLPAVYLAWIAILALLYPMCAWYGRVKAKGRGWWWSYL